MTVTGRWIPAPGKKGNNVYCDRTLPRMASAAGEKHHNELKHGAVGFANHLQQQTPGTLPTGPSWHRCHSLQIPEAMAPSPG